LSDEAKIWLYVDDLTIANELNTCTIVAFLGVQNLAPAGANSTAWSLVTSKSATIISNEFVCEEKCIFRKNNNSNDLLDFTPNCSVSIHNLMIVVKYDEAPAARLELSQRRINRTHMRSSPPCKQSIY